MEDTIVGTDDMTLQASELFEFAYPFGENILTYLIFSIEESHIDWIPMHDLSLEVDSMRHVSLLCIIL